MSELDDALGCSQEDAEALATDLIVGFMRAQEAEDPTSLFGGAIIECDRNLLDATVAALIGRLASALDLVGKSAGVTGFEFAETIWVNK